MKKRLASLDILRGMDLFLLLVLGPVFGAIIDAAPEGSLNFLVQQTEHVDWHGFVLWDIIMPLFMFMSGITIPFSMAKYKNGIKPGKEFYLKLTRRFVILFFLGWIAQGNLLCFDWRIFHPFANTLQSIAVGYVIAAILFVYLKPGKQIIAACILGIAYVIPFICTHMNLDPQDNVAMLVDKAVLGCHRDWVTWHPDGSWEFNPVYQYTWILSSLNFAITVMLGCFAGQVIRKGGDDATSRKAGMLAVVGALLVGAGLAIDPFFPIIKKIWSTSMVLYAGGISFLLIAIMYYIVDVRGWNKGLNWLKWFGMNSITAYCVGGVVDFHSVSNSLLFGLEQWTGEWQGLVIAAANGLILTFILKIMYDRGIFLKA